jgi:hypothetical protein
MNVSENQQPEYYDFLDSHLKLHLLEFFIQNGINKEYNSKIRTEVLSNTYLFNKQSEYFRDNNNELKRIEELKIKVENNENDLKQKIVGYLNLIENAKSSNNYDTSSSINKKIVYNIFT